MSRRTRLGLSTTSNAASDDAEIPAMLVSAELTTSTLCWTCTGSVTSIAISWSRISSTAAVAGWPSLTRARPARLSRPPMDFRWGKWTSASPDTTTLPVTVSAWKVC